MQSNSRSRRVEKRMPEIADPLENLGYLLAAGAITLLALVGYSTMILRRLAESRAQHEELKRRNEGSLDDTAQKVPV